MKTPRILAFEILKSVSICLVVMLVSAFAPAANALAVSYGNSPAVALGNIPFSASTNVVTVFRPRGAPTTSTETLTFRLVLTSPVPAGLTEAALMSFISFSPSTLQFASGVTSQPVTVIITVPRGIVPLGQTIQPAYQAFTVGWSDPSYTDAGFGINATITAPPVPVDGTPVVQIVEPAQTSYTFAYGTPIVIPLNFTAQSAAATGIDAVDATLNGNTIGTVSLPLNTTAYRLPLVTATYAVLPITSSGTYTISANASAAGLSATASKTFSVVITGAPVPTVTITQPSRESDYTYFEGGNPARVPVSITADSSAGGTLVSWAASLAFPNLSTSTPQLSPVSPSGTSATATAPLDLTTSGRYTLSATASNQYGPSLPSLNSSTAFWINRMANPANVTINAFQNASFSVVAAGTQSQAPGLTYQWQRQVGTGGWANVADGGAYSGATTPTLNVTGAIGSMSGDQFRCLIGAVNKVASASAILTVLKLNPVVSWTNPAAIDYLIPLSGTQLNATASYNNVVLTGGSFAYNPASGTVLNAGTNRPLAVVFTPADTVNYNTANGSATITVNQLSPIINWTAPAAISYGTALSSTQLNATATYNGNTVAGSLVYTPASGAVLNAGPNQTLSVSFAPSDTVNYNGAGGTTTITVNKVTPAITWAAPASIVSGTALSATQLNATASYNNASVAGSFVYAPVSGTVLPVGVNQALSVAFTPTNTTNYNSANGGTTLTVTSAPPVVTGPANQTVNVGASAAFSVTATGTPTLTYLWQRLAAGTAAWAALSDSATYTGSATATLNVSGTTAAMSGDQFRCVVTNSAGSATSTAGTLTVNAPATLTIAISQPLDGTVITRVAGSPATSVPFTFKATATGANVTGLSAQVGTTSVTVAATGTNTPTATGTGSFAVSAAGNYTFTAKATGTGTLTASASVTITVKETQPQPQPCTTTVVWSGDVLSTKVLGDKVIDVNFKVKQCCPTTTGGGGSCDDDDDDGDHRSSGGDDNDDSEHYSSPGRYSSGGDDNDDNDSHTSHFCENGGSGGSPNNCSYMKDKTVVVTIYEVLSNGKTGTPVTFTYTSGKATSSKFTIDSTGLYDVQFVPASGKHTYHVDVDYFPVGSTKPTLIGSEEFDVK